MDRSGAPACGVEQRGYCLWLGRSQTSNVHFLGTRVGIVVARTIRHQPSTLRAEASLVVAMGCPPVGWSQQLATHLQVLAHHCKWVAVKTSPSHFDSHKPDQLVATAQSSSTASESSQHLSGGRAVDFGPGNVAPEKLDESLARRQRGRPADHTAGPSPGSPEYTVGCCDGRSYKKLMKCHQKQDSLGFSASSSSRDVLGDVDNW